jgi:hypothetical protein
VYSVELVDWAIQDMFHSIALLVWMSSELSELRPDDREKIVGIVCYIANHLIERTIGESVSVLKDCLFERHVGAYEESYHGSCESNGSNAEL